MYYVFCIMFLLYCTALFGMCEECMFNMRVVVTPCEHYSIGPICLGICFVQPYINLTMLVVSAYTPTNATMPDFV